MKNMKFNVSNPIQEDKIVALIIRPMVLDAVFIFENIEIKKGD